MRKVLVAILGIMIGCTLLACGSGGTTDNVKIDYGESEVFSQEERQAAV